MIMRKIFQLQILKLDEFLSRFQLQQHYQQVELYRVRPSLVHLEVSCSQDQAVSCSHSRRSSRRSVSHPSISNLLALNLIMICRGLRLIRVMILWDWKGQGWLLHAVQCPVHDFSSSNYSCPAVMNLHYPIAKDLRCGGGMFVLILLSKWSRLDFVLEVSPQLFLLNVYF